MLCERCQKEIAEGAAFCGECGYPVNRNANLGTGAAVLTPPVSESFLSPETPDPADPVLSTPIDSVPAMEEMEQPTAPEQPAFVPTSFAAPDPVIASQPFAPAPIFAAPQPSYAPVGYPGFVPQVEEGDYYHFDATEVPDFEGMRGISIAMIIISACTLIGVLFPMPLCIVSLIKSCNGIGERNKREALRKFDTCKTMIIISVVTVLIYVIGLIALMLLMGYTFDLAGVTEATEEELKLFFR